MPTRALMLLLALCGLFPIACDDGGHSGGVRGLQQQGPASNQVLSQEDRAVLEEAKRKRAELQTLKSDPDRFIRKGGWDSYDKGIINDYTRVTAVELTNTASFDIFEIEGTFDYMSKSGKLLATVPIKFKGELRAGDTRKLKAQARTISGKAAKGSLTVTQVRVRE